MLKLRIARRIAPRSRQQGVNLAYELTQNDFDAVPPFATVATIAATAATAAPVTNTNANGDEKVSHARVIRHHQGFNAMAQARGGDFVNFNANYGSPDRW